MDKLFFVYILANCPRGVLYVGVTGDLVGRITVHKAKLAPGFTKTHGVVRLAYFEESAAHRSARATRCTASGKGSKALPYLLPGWNSWLGNTDASGVLMTT